MKIQRHVFQIMLITLAAIAGIGLGYLQNDVNLSLGRVTVGALIIGIVGWIAAMIWWGVKLKTHRLRVIFLLTVWLFTLVSGTMFLVISATGYRTFIEIILISGFSGTAYNFYIVVLPMLLLLRMLASIAAAAKHGIPSGTTIR